MGETIVRGVSGSEGILGAGPTEESQYGKENPPNKALLAIQWGPANGKEDRKEVFQRAMAAGEISSGHLERDI